MPLSNTTISLEYNSVRDKPRGFRGLHDSRISGPDRSRPQRTGALILFGSGARGDSKPNSDYDILVVMPEKDRRVIDALYDATMEVLYKTHRLISLKIYRKADFDRFAAMPTPFMRSVLHDGVRIG